MLKYLLGWIAAASVVAFLMYGLDKSKARRSASRISEAKLHAIAILGGWPGAAIGRRTFRHKTQKTSFVWRFWVTGLLFAAWVAAVTVAIAKFST